MKKADTASNQVTEGLSRKEKLDIQIRLGVFLDKPTPDGVLRNGKQQFAVYDEDEKFVANISPEGQFFAVAELEEKIKALFGAKT
ncbi:MAG: hypothetical protein KBD65_01020 [Candidatus Moranbacteria bacterium]|nr:hypothetical protein [Candidatus Moranbacteria bacterium]